MSKETIDIWEKVKCKLVTREFLQECITRAQYAMDQHKPTKRGFTSDYERRQFQYWDHVACGLRWAWNLAETSFLDKVIENGFEYIEPRPDERNGSCGDSSEKSIKGGRSEGNPFTD